MDLFLRNGSRVLAFSFLIGICAFSANQTFTQSTLPDFPTPITTNELAGVIKSRDVGDARLTTYYYWFEGSQGDVFINVITKNFAGDIDIFVQSGLKPLTKVVVYPDFGEIETGRVIYLRKPERLLVRVQGRSPNDETSIYRLKFAGSFIAAAAAEDLPEIPKVSADSIGSVRVNSVGTILPPIPKPVKVDADDTKKAVDDASVEEKSAEIKTDEQQETAKSEKEIPKLEVVVTDDIPKETKVISPPKPAPTARRGRNARRQPVKAKVEKAPVNTEPSAETSAAPSDAEKKTEEAAAATPPPKTKADPMANFQLVIVFKDGRRIERPMTEVFRFSVDRGVLTVVSKGGRTGRYSMVEVAKVSIE